MTKGVKVSCFLFPPPANVQTPFCMLLPSKGLVGDREKERERKRIVRGLEGKQSTGGGEGWMDGTSSTLLSCT